MTRFVGLLRAVNVGGTGKLPMADLRAICAEIGFGNAQTYIASGNVVFDWAGTALTARAALEKRLAQYAGKPIGVLIRDAAEMSRIIAENPFADAPGNQVVTMFLQDPPPADALDHARNIQGERMALGVQEIYVHYPDGQGSSKLQIPVAATGTARNMNTIRRLADMVGAPV